MQPYYDHAGIQIINAHVIDALRDMEDESIQCCVTSPPYWGLRDYGLKPQIWDSQDGCEHVWGDEIARYLDKRTVADKAKASKLNITKDRSQSQSFKPNTGEAHQGQFCQICGAWKGSLGLEPTPELYIQHMTEIFREIRRVLRKDGTCWLNLGDSYYNYLPGGTSQVKQSLAKSNGAVVEYTGKRNKRQIGLKEKDLIGIPWRVALSLQSDGWWLRSDIIWNKPNPMPESVTDRPTKAHEYIFLLTKSSKYYYDHEAIKEDGVDYEIERRKKELAKGLNTKHIISSDGKTGQQPQSEGGAVKNLKHRQELIIKGKRNKRSV